MKGKALEGELKGEELTELPISEKMTWKEWREKHPGTRILSVDGKENARNKLGKYFTSAKGFRGIKAKDKRLDTKTPIFAFHRSDKSFAIRYSDANGGKDLPLPGGGEVFLYRIKTDNIMRSTAAFASATGFTKKDGQWVEDESGAVFDEAKRSFDDASVERIGGFDTYWYNWSLNNPETEVYLPEHAEGSGSKK